MARRKSDSNQQSLDKRVGTIENLLSQLVQGRNDISAIFSHTTGETSGNNDTRKRTASVDEDKGAKRRRSNGGNFECTLCEKTYKVETSLIRHYKTNHTEMPPERAHRENQVGNKSGKGKTNVDKAVSQKQINCKLCEATFNSTSARNSHYARKHHIIAEKLLFFSDGSALVESSLEHQIRLKPEWFKAVVKRNMSSKICKLCLIKAELDKDSLKWHYENFHKVIQMDKVKNLIRLSNTDIEQVAVTQKCNYCSDVFTDTDSLENHMATVHASNFSECKICNKTIAKTNHNDHVKNEHGDLFNKKVDVSATKLAEIFESIKKQVKPGTEKKAKTAEDAEKQEAITSSASRASFTPEPESSQDILMYMCDACNLVTCSYDNVVAHSQDHILSNVTKEPEFCDICDLQFDVDFALHKQMHASTDNLDRDSFRFVSYDFRDVTSDNDKWFDMFDAFGKSMVNRITSESIYFATRCIRLKLVSDCKDPSAECTLFQCVTCTNYVDPKCIETHVGQRNACTNQCISHQCGVCTKLFYTQGARDDHVVTHSTPGADSRYRTVSFNDPNDFVFNKTLLENAGKSDLIEEEGINAQNVAKAQTPAHRPIAVTKDATPEGVKKVNKVSNENETTSNAKPKEEKVADVYKCSCDLCFHTLQSLCMHMTKCSPESKKTRRIICMCDLIFDEENYDDHCKVHRDDITTFNIKMVDFVNVMKIDVGGMTEEFRKDYRRQQNSTKETDKVNELKDQDGNANQHENFNKQISSTNKQVTINKQGEEIVNHDKEIKKLPDNIDVSIIRSNIMANQEITDKAIIENNPKSEETNNNTNFQETFDTLNDKNSKNSDDRNIEDYDEDELLKDTEDDVNVSDDVDITIDEDTIDSGAHLTKVKAKIKSLVSSFGSEKVTETLIEFMMNREPNNK